MHPRQPAGPVQPDPVRLAVADSGHPGTDLPGAGAPRPPRRRGHRLRGHAPRGHQDLGRPAQPGHGRTDLPQLEAVGPPAYREDARRFALYIQENPGVEQMEEPGETPLPETLSWCLKAKRVSTSRRQPAPVPASCRCSPSPPISGQDQRGNNGPTHPSS